GSRVRMVVSELRGEKIDIIPYNDEPARFVAKALSPARVREVLVDDQEQQATVIVPDDQLSLAIGRDGQNARLAAKLTGWKVDIKSEQEFSEMEQDLDIEEEGAESLDGRCSAVLSAGRRCPNTPLPSLRYCGLPQHQALARFGTNQVTILEALTDDEVSTLADPDAGQDELRPLIEKAEAVFDEKEAEEAAKAEAAAAEAAEAEAAEAAEAAKEAEAEAAKVEAAEQQSTEDAETEADDDDDDEDEPAVEEAEEAPAEDEEPVAETPEPEPVKVAEGGEAATEEEPA
ncbi:MAG: hypothetical protein ACR2OC_04180, partial [Solirubrobacterales bacterium]